MRCEISMCKDGPNIQPVCTHITYIHRLSFDRPTSFFILKKPVYTSSMYASTHNLHTLVYNVLE